MVRLVKICLIGDRKTGKSQLMLNFGKQVFGTYPRFENIEEDLDIYGQCVRVRVYDAPCQDEARRLRMALYPNCDAVVLCASLDNLASLENLSKKWLEELRTARMTRHPLLLALTKSDLRVDSSADLIKPDAISQNARKLQVTDLFECSAKTGENVKQTFRRAAELVVRNDGEKSGKCCAIS
ncbi:Ras-like GTP-binding protein rho [Clonorchis sinensis]|uniref:Ras-like GTP-binding protein rho n=1 Tax=Clonorchis sinensis TaxID=79923 RepID=A0A3R7C6G6_CLOSI|nr:Ras-like GTP-binding protein rho [Clonorchis sinensis]